MNRKSIWYGIGALTLFGAMLLVRPGTTGHAAGADDDSNRTATTAKPEQEGYLYELRTYTTLPGRLPALHKRFSEHTLRIFEKHGMKNVYYFTPDDKDDTLVYLLAHKNRESADASWEAFRNDPDWQRAREESEKDGRIVMKVERLYLTPTDYSPKK